MECYLCGHADRDSLIRFQSIKNPKQIVFCCSKITKEGFSHAILHYSMFYEQEQAMLYQNGWKLIRCNKCKNNDLRSLKFKKIKKKFDFFCTNCYPQNDINDKSVIKGHSINHSLVKENKNVIGDEPDLNSKLTGHKNKYYPNEELKPPIFQTIYNFEDMSQFVERYRELVKSELGEAKNIKRKLHLDTSDCTWNENNDSFSITQSPSKCKILHVGRGVIYRKNENFKENGTVISNECGKILIKLRNSINEDNKGGDLIAYETEVPYKRMLDALARCPQELSESIKNILIGNQFELEESQLIDEYEMINMKKMFKEIADRNVLKITNELKNYVDNILSNNSISVITGSCGSGKTTFLALLTYLYVCYGKKVLLLSHTNVSADNLYSYVSKIGIFDIPGFNVEKDIVRVYGENYEDVETSDNIKIHAADSSFEKAKRKLVNDPNYEHIHDYEKVIISEAKIVATTTVCCGCKRFENFHPDIIMIDDANQCPDPELLISLLFRPEKVILAGDDQQYSPYVLSMRASQDGLGISLIEKIMRRKGEDGYSDILSQLNTNYRINPVIFDFIKETFYPEEEKPRISKSEEQGTFKNINTLNPDYPILFWHVPKKGKKPNENKSKGDKFSYYNEKNIEIIEQVLEELTKVIPNFQTNQVAIITPYIGQLDQYQKHFPEFTNKSFERVKRDTIDAFQGSERDIIILDCVRSNNKHKPGFLSQKKRFLASISRFTRLLIIIGDVEVFDGDERWRSLIELIHANNGVVEGSTANLLTRYVPKWIQDNTNSAQ